MKFLILILGFFSFLAVGQPMLNPYELNVEYHIPEQCWDKNFATCSSNKIVINMYSGSITDAAQFSVVTKVSGKTGVGKVGGQLWYRFSDSLWIGGESSTSFHKLDLDHEIFFAYQIGFGAFTFFPYVGILLATEHFGTVGAKNYIGKNFSWGGEVRFGDEDKGISKEFIVIAGFKVNDKDIKNLFKIFNLKESESLDKVKEKKNVAKN